MEIGFFFWPYSVEMVRGMGDAAERYGYDMIGIADTPGNAMDPWVAVALAAERVRRARIALCVTNLEIARTRCFGRGDRLARPPGAWPRRTWHRRRP